MKIIIQDLAVNYIDVGSGPVVVVLHGWGTNAANMKPAYEHLSRRFRVIAPDLPGFGSSEVPKADWGVSEYVDFVDKFLTKLGISGIYCLIGHSFGGRITIKSVGERIINTEKVVLIGSAGVKHSDSLRNVMYKFVAKIGKVVFSSPGLRRFFEPARKRLYLSAGSMDYLQANNMSAIFTNIVKEDLQASAAKIDQPSLLIWGANDHEAPVDDGKILNGLIKDSKLVIIDNAGHFVHSDQTELVQQELDRFL